jgi:hypothetical protein
MFRWKKLGLLFQPDGSHPLMRSYAAVPVAQCVENDLFRIYFSARDEQNRSRTFSLLWNAARPDEVFDVESTPFLDIGETGAFDDSGAMLTWITDTAAKDKLYYYIGWNLGVTVPFRNALGVALVRESRVVKRYSGPTLDRALDEPHFIGSACVLRDESGVYRNWYLSCVGWDRVNGKLLHRYHIKYAESDDGLHWRRTGRVAIDFAHPGEFAISRPSVVRDRDSYRMWYSYRGEQYRIGYAESADGIAWERRDADAGIVPSSDGWDGKAIAYPHVFDHKGTRFMLYNGNDYGRTGFGIAVAE